MGSYKCSICGKDLDDYTAYEYRGMFSCEEHFDDMLESRDYQRHQIMKEESKKTEPMRGLDFGDNVVGKANTRLLSRQLEIASKESYRLKEYEGRK